MTDLFVTDLAGQTEILTNYKDLAIKQRVNGEHSFSFILLKTNGNSFSYPLVQEESTIEYDGQSYVIKNLVENSKGNKAVKTVQAEHIFFSLIDHYIYEQLIEGDYAINTLLALVFAGSGYTYSVDGSFTAQYFEGFGLDNALSLVNLICNTFGAEIERNNKHVTFKRQIGREIDFQFRYRHNTKTISKSVSTANLSTIIRGYADKSEYGIYMVEATYRSPMADVYGERHAKPVYADDLVYESSLQTRLQESINDKPDVSYSLEFIELKKLGYPYEVFEIGDTVFTIWEPLNIDIRTRIVEYTYYPHSPNKSVVTLANFKNSASDILADFGRTKENIDKIITDGGKIRFSAMDDQVKRSTEALLNSMTELEYPSAGGIIGRSKTDPNDYTVFNSNGFGIYRAGQLIEAITSAGFNLSAGVIGKLTADNINATNLKVNAANILGTLDASQVNVKNKTGSTFTGITNNGLEVVVNSIRRLWITEETETGVASAIVMYGINGERMASIFADGNYGFGINVPSGKSFDVYANYVRFHGEIYMNNDGLVATQNYVNNAFRSGLKEAQVQLMIDNAIADHVTTHHSA